MVNYSDEESVDLSAEEDEAEIVEKPLAKPSLMHGIRNRSFVESEETKRNSRARIQNYMQQKMVLDETVMK